MITKHNLKFFNHAQNMSILSDYHNKSSSHRNNTKVGCVAVYKGKVISTGFNMDRTHPLQMKYNKYRGFNNEQNANVIHKLHAEIACLSPLIILDKYQPHCIQWNKIELYVYRKCRSREHGNARPCKACMSLIRDLGVKNVYYTTDDGYAYEEIV